MTCRCTGRETVGGDGGLDAGGTFTLGAAGGIFTLGDTEGTVTLGNAEGIGTYGDGGVTICTAGCEGTMMGSAGLVMSLSNVLERSTMDVSGLGKQGGRRWVGEGLCQGLRCDDGCIDKGCFWNWTLVWK